MAIARFLCLASILVCLMAGAVAQTDVLTQHNNIGRTGWNDKETLLTKANVNASTFGRLFTRQVDDQMYAQPLVRRQVNIPGKGLRDVVFAATVSNTVYAFDADSASVTQPYWQVNYTVAGSRPVNKADMTGACGGFYNDFSGNIGIVGTPVIDSATGTMYFVARSVNNAGKFYQYLHAVDITSGAEQAGSPVLIKAAVNGYGDGSSGGKVAFSAQHQNQRCGLLLVNGNVYIGWSSHCDWPPYHGWIIAYDKSTLAQKYVYCSTPNGYNGGIWMSGGGPAADENGNIYAAVGNGSVGSGNNPSDPINRSETALQLTPGLTISSFFTPQNYEVLEGADLDFGVTQMMLIPNTNRAAVGVKDGHIYLLNRDNMGGYSAGGNQNVQAIDLGSNAFLRSSMSYYKGAAQEYMYSWSENSLLRAFPYNRGSGTFDLANTVSSGLQGPTGNSGAVLSVSSNGSVDSTAILWASFAANGDANQSVRPGILRAIDATDVTKELWNSSNDINDDPGNYAKFNCPTIANGKVYLGTFSNQLLVYGLRKATTPGGGCGTQNLALSRPSYTSSVEDISYSAPEAFDGSLATRWSSQYSDPQYLAVQLDKQYDLCKVVLKWETALGSEFKIQISNDNSNWVDVAHIVNNNTYTNVINITGHAQYVRMYGIQRGTQWGYSLYEMQVFGAAPITCAKPDSLYSSDIYGNSAIVHWKPGGAAHYLVQYKTVTATNWQQAVADTSFFAITSLACNTPYLYQVKAICGSGDTSEVSTSESFTTLACDANCDPLPTRWSTEDVGNPALSGEACYNSSTGVFELHGYGTDIGGTADQLRYAFKTLVGNGELKTRITDIDNADGDNKFGIMVRESLAPGAKMAFIGLTNASGAVFITRTQTDGNATAIYSSATIKAPYWVKVKISGSVFTAFISPDGLSWQQLGVPVEASFANGQPVYEGLGITSHNENIASVGHADNYVLSGVLPLRLISFTGQMSLKNTVDLRWVTTLESNMKYFVVERTNDNMYYKAIDTVYADNDGDYAEVYTVSDVEPREGMNYYRLRIYSNDGTISFSPIVAVKFSNILPPKLYPNPANNFVNIEQGNEAIRQVRIYTVMGRPVVNIQFAASQGSMRLPVYNLSNGLYFIEVRTAQNVYRDKIIVHN